MCGQFCFNAILSHVRAQGDVALAVASSGIASILLGLGRTFHSRFKASLKPKDSDYLNIKSQTALARLVRMAKVIVWDEAPMQHRHHLEALDRTLRDLMKEEQPELEHVPFGGKIIVRQHVPSSNSVVQTSHPARPRASHLLTVSSSVAGAGRRLPPDPAHCQTWLTRTGRRRLDQLLLPVAPLQTVCAH